MPKELFHALSAAKVRQIKEPGRYADGSGLYLHVAESGARWWIWRGTVYGRRVELGMGSARLIPLAEARQTAVAWRRIAREGGDPRAERDKGRRETLTFTDAAGQVYAEQIEPESRDEKRARVWLTSLERYAMPHIGRMPVHAVTQADILRVLSPIWTAKPETARRVRQRLRTVFDWARVSGHRDSNSANPVEGVEKALPKQRDRVQHFSALPWRELPALMRRLEGVEGMGVLALRFAILTAARSGEVRGAMWDEINVADAVWTVPASRMKVGEEHRVPLTQPALDILDGLRGLSDGLIFPGAKRGRMLSDMTLAAVLKRLSVPVTPHGFRSTFRDWAEEVTDFPHEVKEAALAHKTGSKVERAYRRTDLFEKRRELMQAWANYCGGGDGEG